MDVMHANYCNDVIVMVERSLFYTKIVQVRAKSSSLNVLSNTAYLMQRSATYFL